MARNLTITVCMVPTSGRFYEDTKGVWHRLPDLGRFPQLGHPNYGPAYRAVPLERMPVKPRLRVVMELDVGMDGFIQAVRQNGAVVECATVRVLLGSKYKLYWKTVTARAGYRASDSMLEAVFTLPPKPGAPPVKRSSLLTSAAAVMPPGWALFRKGTVLSA